MLAIAAEELVGALARKRHGDLLAGQLAEREEPERGQVGERLVEMPHERAQRPPGRSAARPRARCARPRRQPRPGARREAPSPRRQSRPRTSSSGLGHVARHQGDDQAGVETAAQHRAERDVAHQPQSDGLVELVEQDLGPFLGRAAGRVGIGSRIAPPALDRHAPVARRRAAPRARACGPRAAGSWARARSRASGRPRSPRGRARCSTSPLASTHLSSEPKTTTSVGDCVVERLDAQAVADEYAAALVRSHTATANIPRSRSAKLRAVLLVEVREHLGVAAAARDVAARAAAPGAARRGCRSRRSGPPIRGRSRSRTAGGRPRRR